MTNTSVADEHKIIQLPAAANPRHLTALSVTTRPPLLVSTNGSILTDPVQPLHIDRRMPLRRHAFRRASKGDIVHSFLFVLHLHWPCRTRSRSFIISIQLVARRPFHRERLRHLSLSLRIRDLATVRLSVCADPGSGEVCYCFFGRLGSELAFDRRVAEDCREEIPLVLSAVPPPRAPHASEARTVPRQSQTAFMVS